MKFKGILLLTGALFAVGAQARTIEWIRESGQQPIQEIKVNNSKILGPFVEEGYEESNSADTQDGDIILKVKFKYTDKPTYYFISKEVTGYISFTQRNNKIKINLSDAYADTLPGEIETGPTEQKIFFGIKQNPTKDEVPQALQNFVPQKYSQGSQSNNYP